MGTIFEDVVIQQDLSAADLLLEAEIDRGFLIHDIGITGHNTPTVLELYIGEEIMLAIPTRGSTNQVAPVRGVVVNNNELFASIRRKYPDVPLLRVDAGQQLKLHDPDGVGVAYVRYTEFDGADIPSKTDPGGSENETRLLISSGILTQSVPASSTDFYTVDVSANPPGIFEFPYGRTAQANKKYMFLGFAMVAATASHTDVNPTGVRMWKKNKAFLAKDQNFADPALFPYAANTTQQMIRYFETPVEFGQNDEHKVEVELTNVNVGAQTGIVLISCIYLVSPAG